MPAHQPDRPDLTAAQERAVRDLLAGARHTEPLPDDVASRLDATLGELAAERAAGTSSETSDAPDAPAVVSLARRRRRRVGLGLVAAAALVVGGVAVTEVVPQTTSGGGSESAGSGVADDGSAGGGVAAGESRRRRVESASPQADSTRSYAAVVPTIEPDTFRDDVLRTRRLAERGVLDDAEAMSSQPEGGAAAKSDRDLRQSLRARADRCERGVGPGRTVLVQYAGRRAVLVLRPARDDRQQAVLYRCGDGAPVRSVELPGR